MRRQRFRDQRRLGRRHRLKHDLLVVPDHADRGFLDRHIHAGKESHYTIPAFPFVQRKGRADAHQFTRCRHFDDLQVPPKIQLQSPPSYPGDETASQFKRTSTALVSGQMSLADVLHERLKRIDTLG